MKCALVAAALAGVGLAALTACDYDDPSFESVAWEAQLVPALTHPGLEGQAAVVTQLAGTDAGISLSGGQPDARHTWQVRHGGCAAPGDGIGPPTDYPVLAVDSSGTASAETHLGPRLARDSTYHVEVREGTADTSRIACGNLSLY